MFVRLFGLSVITFAIFAFVKLAAGPLTIFDYPKTVEQRLAAMKWLVVDVAFVPFLCGAWLAMVLISSGGGPRQALPVTGGGLLVKLFQLFWRAFATWCVFVAVAGVGSLLCTAIGFFFYATTLYTHPFWEVTEWGIILAVAVSTIAVSCWAFVRVGLFGVIVALECPSRKEMGPVERSWRLMKGHAWAGLWVWLVPVVCSIPGLASVYFSCEETERYLYSQWHFAHPALFWYGWLLIAAAFPLFATTPLALYRALRSEG